MSLEQDIRNKQFKQATGSAPNFRAIDGVGPKTAEKVKGTIIEGEGRVQAPTDVQDLTDDELADKAGISKTRARKVIKGAGGNPDRKPRGTSGSVEAGNIANALDERTASAGEVVSERRDVFEGVVEVGEEVPDRRQRKRGEFGPLDDEDPDRVRELGRAAETFRRATNDPIDPTEDRDTFGFDDVETAREKAARVSLTAQRKIEQEEGVDFGESTSQIESGQPDVATVDSVVSRLTSPTGTFARGPTTPTDIGREPDGEFARPETAPDIEPAPVARKQRTGEFGLDPFDITSSTAGASLDTTFGGDTGGGALGGGRGNDTGGGETPAGAARRESERRAAQSEDETPGLQLLDSRVRASRGDELDTSSAEYGAEDKTELNSLFK